MSADEALAQRLQDTVLTPLHAVATRLDSLLALTREPPVQRRVAETAAELERVAAALRSQLRDLQRADDDGAVAALRDRVLDAGQRMGCVPRFAADAAVADLEPGVLADVMAVVGEGVDNVVRHAYAGNLEVTITAGAQVVVTVVDDGVGPDDDAPGEGGLARLAALAEARGGTSEITANPDGFGSTLTWRIPG